MKRITSCILLIALALALSGCAAKSATTGTVPTAPPTLPQGARDTADANAFRVIADAYALISSIRNSVTSGKLTLTATQKTVFNDLVNSYNVAYATGLAYHSGASSDATTLTQATANLTTHINAATTQIQVAK